MTAHLVDCPDLLRSTASVAVADADVDQVYEVSDVPVVSACVVAAATSELLLVRLTKVTLVDEEDEELYASG